MAQFFFSIINSLNIQKWFKELIIKVFFLNMGLRPEGPVFFLSSLELIIYWNFYNKYFINKDREYQDLNKWSGVVDLSIKV
jgi:hypothetical protein